MKQRFGLLAVALVLLGTLTAQAMGAPKGATVHELDLVSGQRISVTIEPGGGAFAPDAVRIDGGQARIGANVRLNVFDAAGRATLVNPSTKDAVLRLWVRDGRTAKVTKKADVFTIAIPGAAPTPTTTTTAAPTTTTTAAPTTTTTAAPATTTTAPTPTTLPTTTAPIASAADDGTGVRSAQDPSGRVDFAPISRTHYSYTGSGRSGFISTCSHLRRATVDPILFPGSRTRSHAHDFFGNMALDENATTDSLIASRRTSCQHRDDLSAYWTPTAMERGRTADVVGTSMYYFTDAVERNHAMKVMPVGLRMIAGSANATGPQSPTIASFEEHRNARNNTRGGGASMVTARRTGQVVARVNFPQCWDGKRLDSPDHKSHMAYATKGRCPSSHPVLLPQLTEFVRYDADGGSDFELSSGPWYTAHADFWNAWNPRSMAEILDHCRNTHCGRVSSR